MGKEKTKDYCDEVINYAKELEKENKLLKNEIIKLQQALEKQKKGAKL